MTDNDESVPSIGRRIASYRKLGKMATSADLAARIPNPKVTASVIQNIESGRKADLSVSQLLDIAMGLGVSPLVLLVPVGRPFQPVDLPGVGADVSALTVHEFDEWLTIPKQTQQFETPDRATLRRVVNYVRELIDAVEDWKEASVSPDLTAKPFEYEALTDEGEIYMSMHHPSDAAWMGLASAETSIKSLSSYLRHFNVDLSWVPDVDAPKVEGNG
jgi:transcriptional regulator with XRE-family HTH domain